MQLGSATRRRFSLPRILGVVAIVAVAGAACVTMVDRSFLSQLFGGDENMAIVREATRVEAYRLAPPEGTNPMHDETSPLEYQTVSGPVAVRSETAQALQKTLLSPGTYWWYSAKECGYPVYGVKLSFMRGDDRVDVYFCFSCSMLAVVRDRTAFFPEDFDDGERVIIEAMKELFPDDAEIQAIRE